MVVLKELSQILGLFRRPREGRAPRGDGLTDRPLARLCWSSSAPGPQGEELQAWPTRSATGSTALGVVLEDRPDGTALENRA